MSWALLAILGYVLGSVPAGYVVGRLFGIDVRQHGSGNIGATNVMRTLGVGPAAGVALFDFLKGAVPVYVAYRLGQPPVVQAWAGAWAVCGHMWPFTLGFRGGKGVATGVAVLALVNPVAALASLAVFVALVAVTRYVSLGSLATAVVAPLYLLVTGADPGATSVMAVVGSLVIWRHRGNIRRLLGGTEARFGQRSPVRE